MKTLLLILFGFVAGARVATASTLWPDSLEYNAVDKIASESAPQFWLNALQPMSEEYAFTLLESSEETSPWRTQLRDRIYDDLNSTTLGSGDFWLNVEARSGFEFLRSRPTPLLQVQAVTNPFHFENDGMFTGDGTLGFVGTRVTGHASRYFSFRASPYLLLSSHDDTFDDHLAFFLKEGVASLHIRRFVIEAGRDATRWGSGRIGHLLFSGESEPFNLVRARSDEPIIPIDLLSFLGPTKFEMFFTYLDKNREFPHARLFGTYLSFLPHPRFEWGFGETVLFGGTGAPTHNPLIIFSEKVTATRNPANRNFLASARWKIPILEIEPYGELLWEDCCGVNPFNPRDVMNLTGLYFPKLDPEGKLDLALEWVRTNHIAYRHQTYSSGYVYKNQILGHPLGPDAMGVYALFRYFCSEGLLAKLLLSFELRGRLGRQINDSSVTTVAPGYQAGEQRHRAMMEFNLRPTSDLTMTPKFGIERVTNENYIQGQGRWNGLAGFDVSYAF